MSKSRRRPKRGSPEHLGPLFVAAERAATAKRADRDARERKRAADRRYNRRRSREGLAFSVFFGEDLFARVVAESERLEVSRSEVVRRALECYFARR